MRFVNIVASLALLMVAGQAEAASYALDAVVDFTGQSASASYYGVQNVTNSTTIASLSAGDTVTGTISFANNMALTLQDIGGYERVYAFLNGQVGQSVDSSSTITLLGVQGAPAASSFSGGAGGCCALAGVSTNFTNSSVSFTGLGYTIYITGGGLTGARFTQFSTSAASIAAAVPEPVNWAMMLGGMGMIGSVMRSHKRRPLPFA